MANFCGKCGSKLIKGNCPKCSRDMRRKSFVRRLVVIISCILAAVCAGAIILVNFNPVENSTVLFLLGKIGLSSQDVEADSAEMIDKITGGDITEINEVIFSEYNALSNGDYVELFEEEKIESGNENGILAELFSMAQIELLEYSQTTLTYNIEAPDMSEFFDTCTETLSDEAELAEKLVTYAVNAPKRSVEVTIAYRYIDGNFIADYKEYEFINAISGGLAEAYVDLYNLLLEQYRNEMKNE